MKRAILFVAFAALSLVLTPVCQAVDLRTYYYNANGKKAAALKMAMKGIISKSDIKPYGSLWTYYEETDYIYDKNGNKRVFDYYSDIVAYFPEPSTMNKEHTVPQSWWGGGTGPDQGSDLFQVLPSEKNANSAKSSYPLGVVTGSVKYPGKGVSNTRMKTGKDKNNKMVFEPCDEYKGDFARIYMYVATCYSNVNWQRQSDLGCVLQEEDYPTFISKDFIKMLLQWNRQDPVSEWEQTRNERVYAIQNNRNPFVDYPSLAEFIWGDSITYAFDVALPHAIDGSVTPTPGDDPDPQPGDDPDPQPGDDPGVNPEVGSCTIVFTDYKWTATKHPTYGNGYTATINGLTLSFFKANSQTEPVDISKYNEFRFYDKSVFIIEGAEITGVTFHAGDRKGEVIIDGETLSFTGSDLAWTGSMNPFMCTASAQSRISSIDITVKESEGTTQVSVLPLSLLPDSLKVFSAEGKFLGRKIPARRGTYIVRRGGRVRKYMVK